MKSQAQIEKGRKDPDQSPVNITLDDVSKIPENEDDEDKDEVM